MFDKFNVMRTKVFLIGTALMVGCAARAQQVSLGTYRAQTKDSKYILELKDEERFTLTFGFWDGKSSCDGSWEVIDRNTILLKCAQGKFPAQVTSSYMTIRERRVLILSHRKLRLDKTTLKLQKTSSKV